MREKNIEFGKYKMRLLKADDVDMYYKDGFEESSDEANYYTGSTDSYTKEQISTYVQKVVDNFSRYDFIISNDDEIIGEVVINDIEDNNCHYRICIFKKENFSKGIGYNATVKIIEFAFDDLGLESVELEVFPFNKRGISLYKKIGFKIEDTIVDEDAEEPYRNIITMRLVKEHFNNSKG